ncbi:MAG TPA: DUF2169 domain-containing protein, partial [Minicystis sp.]|nr:DUF2169 domain-containing protein [Minicystis sp.]
MQVLSLGPLRGLGVPWQPRPGSYALTVVAKATFDLRPVVSPLAEQQDDPNEDDNHWDDDPAKSVYAPNDAAPFKPRADVVLVGDAFAPHREPVRSLVARVVVAGLDKSIEVFGNRTFASSGAPRDAAPFVKMPLRYERAAGGPDTDNPVGLGPDAAAAPNLVRPGATVARGAVVEPVGFGPLAPSWPVRARLLARANGWTPKHLAEQPVPEQLPSSFFNVAPVDQQVYRLAADEHLVLENLSAEHPLLVTNLPGVAARAFARRDGDLEEVKLSPDTLWIDTSRGVATLVFRGQLALSRRSEPGTLFVLTEEAARPLTWAEVKRACDGAPREVAPSAPRLPSLIASDGTIDSADLATNALRALPFAPRPRRPSTPPVAPPRPRPALPFAAEES